MDVARRNAPAAGGRPERRAPDPRVPYRPGRRIKAWAADAAAVGLPFLGLLYLTPLRAVPRALSDAAAGPLASAVSVPFSLPGLLAFGPDAARASAGPAFVLAAYVCLLALYSALFEGFLGATPGQRGQGLAPRLADPSSARCPIGTRRALWRAAARPLDGLLFGIVGAAVALANDGRRLGDLLAGTVLDEAPALRPPHDHPSAPGSPVSSIEAAKRRAGEVGERALRQAFAPMAAEGWTIFFGLPHRAFGDVDLLLVGPAGVFIVDAKSHRGLITEDPNTKAILRDGVPFPEDIRLSLRRQADHVSASLFGAPPADVPGLYALLCFTRATLGPAGTGSPGDAFALEDLPDLIRAAPPRLGPKDVERLSRKVEARYGHARYRAQQDLN